GPVRVPSDCRLRTARGRRGCPSARSRGAAIGHRVAFHGLAIRRAVPARGPGWRSPRLVTRGRERRVRSGARTGRRGPVSRARGGGAVGPGGAGGPGGGG